MGDEKDTTKNELDARAILPALFTILQKQADALAQRDDEVRAAHANMADMSTTVRDMQRQTLDELREFRALFVDALSQDAANKRVGVTLSEALKPITEGRTQAPQTVNVVRSQPGATLYITGAPKRGYVETAHGKTLVTTKKTEVRVPVGRTYVNITAAGFKPRRIELEVEKNDELEVDGTLELEDKK